MPRICLGCRTVLWDETTCDDTARHYVADLAVREGRQDLLAAPRSRTRPYAPAAPRARGLIDGPYSALAPCTLIPCSAYAHELVFAGGVTLRDAASGGFDLRLDDGRVARVPRGRCRIEGNLELTEVEPWALEEYLHRIDGQREVNDPLDPIPFHEVRELRLRPGQRIWLIGDLEEIPDVLAPPVGYREAHPVVLRPIGLPWLMPD